MDDSPRIIHRDDAIIVIDKPAGWPAVSLKTGIARTVAAWLVERFPEQAAVGEKPGEAGLVHRLDNDTSGLILAARTNEAFLHLRRQFDDGAVRKEYAALVVGRPPPEGTIDVPIAHHPRKKKKMVACPSERRVKEWKARPAHTGYRVVERFESPSPCALLSVTIATGVRHQIRTHLASLGFPIAGDRLYRNPKMRAADPLPLPRQFLHAARLAFVHPADGSEVAFSSDLPHDLQAALSMLRRREGPSRAASKGVAC